MEDSGAILCQISVYKDMLDQVSLFLLLLSAHFLAVSFEQRDRFRQGEFGNRGEHSSDARDRIGYRQVF